MKVAPFVLLPMLSTFNVMAEQKPNVVVIFADDLFSDLGCYGNDLIKTPNIDRLAASGVKYDRMFVNYPFSGPSRNCILSGRYAEETGLKGSHDLLREVDPNAITLPMHFRNNGYNVARVGKVYHSGNPSGIGKATHDHPASWDIAKNPAGIDIEPQFTERINRASARQPERGFKPKGDLGGQVSWLCDDIYKESDHTDSKVVKESIKLLKGYAKEEEPFFLCVGFYKTHTPFVAPKKYFDLYDRDKMPVPVIPDGYEKTIPKAALARLQNPLYNYGLSEELSKEVIQAYYATVSFLDSNVGKVIDAIDELGIRDNTIIVFLSDHGLHMGEHNYFLKRTLFDQANHTPFIISAPNKSSNGKVCESIFETIDLYPTLSDLASLSKPTQAVGVSFAESLDDVTFETRDCAVSAVDTKGYRNFTIRTKKYRYSRWEDGSKGDLELYDIVNDPAEMHNLASESNCKDIIKRLDKMLSQRISVMSAKPNVAH